MDVSGISDSGASQKNPQSSSIEPHKQIIQACAGNSEKWGRSNFSHEVTIANIWPIKK